MPSTAIKSGDNTILYAPKTNQPTYSKVHREWGAGLEETGEKEIVGRRLTVQDPSRYRQITDLFWTVTRNMWVSLGSLIGATFGVRLKNEDTNEVEAASPEQLKNILIAAPNIPKAIESLRSQTKLGTAAVDEYCKYLAETQKAQYISKCLEKFPIKVADFPEPTHDKILIPIVLKGWFVDHIVAIYITRNEEGATIEYYDSKGLTIADRLNQPLVNNPQMTLGRLVAELSDHYCGDLIENQITVQENTTKQQWDSHNCGVYVCRYFDVRLRGTDTHAIYSEPVNYRHTFAWRTAMVNNLMPIFKDAIKQSAPPEINDDDLFDSEDDDALPYKEPEKTSFQKIFDTISGFLKQSS